MSNSSPPPLPPLGFVFLDSICSSTTSLGRTEKKGFLGIFQFSRRKTTVILQISVAVYFYFYFFSVVLSKLVMVIFTKYSIVITELRAALMSSRKSSINVIITVHKVCQWFIRTNVIRNIFGLSNNLQTNPESCVPFILMQINSWGRLTAWLNSWMHFSCAFRLQTQTTSMDMDDCDDKVIQNTDTQSNVSITNTPDNVQT